MRGVICSRRWATVALLSTACYSYVPLAEPGARNGDELRVHLTTSGAADLAREIGPRVAVVEGRVLQVSADSAMTLAVTQLRSTTGNQTAWEGDVPLVIPQSAVASVERRRLARGRTVAVSTGVTAGLALVGAYAVGRGGKGGGGGPPPPPPP